jgi:serine protease Do
MGPGNIKRTEYAIMLKRFLLFLVFINLGTLPFFSMDCLSKSERVTPAVKVIDEWGPSVVNIATEKVALLNQQPFWKEYGTMFDTDYTKFMHRYHFSKLRLKGIGSGVIVHSDGVIVTNAHVVNMASKIFIVFNNGVSVEGKVILSNQKDDLAFVTINPPYNLNPIKLADPEKIMIGETVISIGNPFGLENSVSVGVVSGKNRNFITPKAGHTLRDLIQTDASINMGSSGGALLNLDGELIGVNLAVAEQAQSIAFAVSVKKIHDGIAYYNELKTQGRWN